MADNVIELKLKVNAETGALEVLSEGLKRVGSSAGSTEKSFMGLTGASGEAARALAKFATAGAIIKFFKDCVQEAEQDRLALQRLGFALEANGVNWDQNKQSVIAWSEQIQKTTRFSNTDAVEALGKFTRVTGELRQAQTLVKIAMGMSAQSGEDMSTVISNLSMLYQGNSRALLTLRKEFGSFVGDAKTAKEAFDNLSKAFYDAAEQEQGLTKESLQLKNNWEDLQKTIGTTLTPGISVLVGWLEKGIQVVTTFTASISALGLVTFDVVKRYLATVKDLFTLNFKGIGEESKGLIDDLSNDMAAYTDTVAQIWEKHSSNIDAISNKPARIDPRIDPKVAEEKKKMDQKYLQMQADLEQSIQGLGTQTLTKKLNGLKAEIAAKKAAIEQEHLLEKQKTLLIEKLGEYELAKKKELVKEERILKEQAAFDIANMAVNTLQTLNELGDKGNEAEKTRAIALMALQQALAIGWAWVKAVEIGGPFAAGIAAAQTAMLVAQFAAQVQAIEKTNTSGNLDVSDITSNLSSGDSVGTIDSGVGSGVSAGGSSGGSTGGATYGGGNVINVGGVQIIFNAEQVTLDNVDAILGRLAQQIRAATVEAVQFAVATQNLAAKKSNLAV